MAQHFLSGGESGVDYAFQGRLVDMRAKDREVYVESLNDYRIKLESSSMYRGLVDPEESGDMIFSQGEVLKTYWSLQ